MKLNLGLSCIRAGLFAGAALWSFPGQCEFQFTGIAAGDADSGSAIIWTRALDLGVPTGSLVTGQVATDSQFSAIVASGSGTPGAATDYTIKFDVPLLTPGTPYYYRFMGPAHAPSATGTFN